MNPHQLHSYPDDPTLFLTATSNNHCPISQKKSNYSPSHYHKLKLHQSTQESHETIKTHILSLVKQFKCLTNCPEISHLFNQILYGLQGFYGEKKSIEKIAQLLQNEKNMIKLSRVWNRLKALKKEFDKLGLEKLDKQRRAQTRIIHSKKSSYIRIKAPQTLSSYNTFHQTISSSVKQLKQNILSQISYRQRIIKIQSKRQKHQENRQKFLQKKLVKAKEMNKKVKEIYEKNRNIQKEQLSNHKYELLYDPQEERLKRRGKTVGVKARGDESILGNDNELVDMRENATAKAQNNNQPLTRIQNRTKKNIKFQSKQEDKFTKQCMTTFKSLKQLINQNIKGSKSFKTITNCLQQDGSKFTVSRPKKLYTKVQQDRSLNRSHSLGKKQNPTNQPTKQPHQQKITTAMNRRLQMQQQRFKKIITQAVHKQKRILKIYQRRTQAKNKKNQQDSQHDLAPMQSMDSSPVKSLFKHVYTRKQLLDKEKKIFEQIENKLQKKEQFLQQRVDKVRERLKKEAEKKQKHRREWDEYIQYSENLSLINSRKGSPSNKDKQNLLFKQQQNIVKNSHFSKLKKIQANVRKDKLASLTIHQLKRKLTEIEAEEQEKRNQQRLVF